MKKNENLVVLADEVYEKVVFDGNELVRFANIEGMWDRTVSIYSAGKTFSMTGLRVGWAIGPSYLIDIMA